jgi:predicted amidohydrolase
MGSRFSSGFTSISSYEAIKFGKQGNLERILASIAIAKERGATLRVGPELEIPYVKPSNICQVFMTFVVDTDVSTIS